MKICPVAAELFDENGQTHTQTDRQSQRTTDPQRTDIMQLIIVFRNFANMPEKEPIAA
jgi:hypothetical protein